jgi:lysozyme
VNIIEQLRREEGVSRSVYKDHLGYWTIGVGRLVDGRKGGGLSDDEIDYLLRNDVERCELEIRKQLPWYDELGAARKAVLVGMAFQMGSQGLFAFTTTLGHIRAGRYEAAAKAMLQSRWAKQTPNRAARMAEQMRSGEWQT